MAARSSRSDSTPSCCSSATRARTDRSREAGSGTTLGSELSVSSFHASSIVAKRAAGRAAPAATAPASTASSAR
jgi:hypothetical protein